MNEHKKGVKAVKKPRNLVAKFSSATTSGSGAHKDKKHAMKRGEVKHKGKQYDYAEHLEKSLENQLEEMFHGGFGGQAKFTKAPKAKKTDPKKELARSKRLKADIIKTEIEKLKNLALSGSPEEKEFARNEIYRLRAAIRGEEVEEGLGKYLVTGAALIAAIWGIGNHEAEKVYARSPQLQKLEQFHTQALQKGDMAKARELEQRILNQKTRLELGKGEVKDKNDKPIDVVYDENMEEGLPVNVDALLQRGDRSHNPAPWWARAGDINYMSPTEVKKDLKLKVYFPDMFVSPQSRHHFKGDEGAVAKAAEDLGMEQDDNDQWYYPVYKLDDKTKTGITRAKYLFGEKMDKVKVEKKSDDEVDEGKLGRALGGLGLAAAMAMNPAHADVKTSGVSKVGQTTTASQSGAINKQDAMYKKIHDALADMHPKWDQNMLNTFSDSAYRDYKATGKVSPEIVKYYKVMQGDQAPAPGFSKKWDAERGVKEGTDAEGGMARTQLLVAAKLAIKMASKMRDDTQLDSWVQSKIAVASDYLETVFDFLEHGQQDVDQVSEGTKERPTVAQTDKDYANALDRAENPKGKRPVSARSLQKKRETALKNRFDRGY